MQDTYYNKIDELREKVNSLQNITLEEACWLIWAELNRTSSTWKEFKKNMESFMHGREMPWPAWLGMFHDWEKKHMEKKTVTETDKSYRFYVTEDLRVHALFFDEIVEPVHKDGREVSLVWRNGEVVNTTGPLLGEFETEREARKYASQLGTVNRIMES